MVLTPSQAAGVVDVPLPIQNIRIICLKKAGGKAVPWITQGKLVEFGKPIRLREGIVIQQDHVIALSLAGCQVVTGSKTQVGLGAKKMEIQFRMQREYRRIRWFFFSVIQQDHFEILEGLFFQRLQIVRQELCTFPKQDEN